VSRSLSIFHTPGSLTGFFAPPGRVDEALLKQLRSVSPWQKRKSRNIDHQTEAGFQPASDIRDKDGFCRYKSGCTPHPAPTIRYITVPGTRQRNLSTTTYKTIICQSLTELQNLGFFPGLTIFEDSVLIPCLEDGDTDMIGTQVRNMATGTEGVIVLGQVWGPPLSQMDPYFDRVVWAYEIPVRRQKKRCIRPDYGQSTICD
jgi:hypothetical protein